MTFKLVFRANWALDRSRDRACAILDHINAIEEISADFVHLVDEHDPRNMIAVSLAPNGFCLRLYAGIGIQHTYRAIENRQRALNFNCEVHVSGRINDVETKFWSLSCLAVFRSFPKGCRRSRRDRNAALLLLLHVVHGRRAIMHFANFVGLTSIVKDTFCCGRFTGINMGHDAKVTITLQRVFAGHGSNLYV